MPSASAGTLPSGFQETTVFSGLNGPTNFRFASDGRVFVAQKDGQILEYDSLSDTTPTLVADLATDVDNFWDRGLLGLALDPNFPSSPYVYALESYDAPIGGTAPKWNDACPTPPGATTDGCVISGRLLRLTLSGNTATSTSVLIKDQWCQQYPSHSIGDLNFGADGALYVSAGDGASYLFADYGQGGGTSGSPPPTPKNPCGDPPAGVGGTMTPPTAEGGALRSQSIRRAAGEPVLLNGSVLRLDPATGNALPDNPNAGSSDANARRIVAYGFRNPFRFTIRPLTNELWVGDVGWDTWEEIDRQPNPTASALNFGWPCYEGVNPQPGYQSAGLSLCSSLYSAGTATAPYFTYNHSAHIATGDACPTGGSSITGVAFYTGAANYPNSYNNGLFFADYSRNCISFMPVGSNGLPDPTRVQSFESNAAGPVDLEIGPNGDLYYADLNSGTIREIAYTGGNHPPTAIATASPTSGSVPLTVNFDGSASSDQDPGDTISYSWDLNGDGTFGDATVAKPSFTYTTAGTYNVQLKVTDNHGASTISAPVSIAATSGGTSTFGTTTPGSLTDSAGADLKEVSKFTAPSAGTIVKVTGYVSGLGAASGSQKIRAVVYGDTSGNPGALLGTSNEVTIAAGKAWGWVDFTFPTQIPIQAGTLWIGYIAGTQGDLTQLRYSTVASDLRYNANPGGYAAGASNPFGTSFLLDFHYSIYATFVPSGGGGTNNPPTAVASGSPTSGSAPLTVNFDGSGSSDPDAGDTISYSWDLNGDGTFGDSTVAKPSYTFTSAGTYNAVLRVTDNHGASTTSAPVTITVSGGNGPSTFGTTTPGSLTDTAGLDFKEVSKFTAPSAGSVTKVSGYVSGLGAASGTQKVRAVLYADSGGNPGALLGTSNEVTITAGQAWGWVDFTFPSAVSIQAGTIWMGYIAGSQSDLTQLRYSSVANDLKYNFDTGGYADGPTNPFGSPITLGFHYSMYATYFPAGSNQPPVPTISTPPSTLTWKVGDLISFSGGAVDPEDGTLLASQLTWSVIMHHCDPTGQTCHTHLIQTFAGVASGSFNAPDHGYPSYLELQLTATDSQGLTATTSVNLQPQVVNLTFASSPSGLQIVFDGTTQATPYTVQAIIGSVHSISAPASQTLGGTTYTFSSWSDSGAATHNITTPSSAATYTATYSGGGGGTNNPPTAVASGSPTSGSAPLTVNFDGSGSSDPDAGDTISYSWDLNGDGTFGDSTVAKPSYTFTSAGTYNAVLRVTDNHGASTTSSPVTITVSASATTFGTTTPGALTDSATLNVKEVSKFTAPRAGNVTKVTGYISGKGASSSSEKIKAVIYADSGGNPGARLGVSSELTISAGRAWGWVDFTFSSPIAIPAGTVWIGYIAGGSKTDLIQMRYDQVAGDLRYNANSYSSGPSNPFGAANTDNFHYSIYATYG